MKKRRIGVLIAASIMTLTLVGCGSKVNEDSSGAPTSGDTTTVDYLSKETEKKAQDKNPVATIEMEDGSIIKVELYPETAPNTVRNFISLANDKFYDGLIFHRVIKDFMIQGGDPLGNGTGGPDYSIYGEFSNNKFENELSHERGVISMARSRDMNSAGSQFFIMHKDNKGLDGDYAAFGKVIEGMDVVDAIAATETNSSDKPVEDMKIKSITVDTFGVEYGAPVHYSK
ncbi:peptidylprolyl isomerase [Clostridium culturomicium]|uniref:peptidylprolyl isomerase n=1 Tax=Clostridium culturomicium TaxID=1499683 RepID=UPI0038575EBF